jgi:NADH-quinone oxidoreductase subunit N
MAGIPPLAGFFSKLCIIFSMLTQDLILLTLLIVTFSSIGCFYYIRLIKIVFFTKQSKNNFWSGNGSRTIEYFIALSTTLITLFLLYPNFINSIAILASISLLG